MLIDEGHNNWGYRMTECVLNIGTTPAPKVFVMSQIMLVGPPLKTGFSTRYKENYTFIKKMWCETLHVHYITQWSSNIQQYEAGGKLIFGLKRVFK